MNSTQIAQIIFLVIVIIAAVIGTAKVIYNKVKTVDSAQDFIDLLTEEADKIFIFIAKQALEEELDGCMTYDEFHEKCKEKFAEQLYNYLLDEDNRKYFSIPDNLKQFVTKENVLSVMDYAFNIVKIDDLIYNTYTELVKKRYNEIEAVEQDTVNKNAEIGVEDETTLEKEDLGLTHENEDENNFIDIGGELNSSINDKDLIEPIED